MGHFNAQDLANMAWSFATVNLLDEKLFMALATAIGLNREPSLFSPNGAIGFCKNQRPKRG